MDNFFEDIIRPSLVRLVESLRVSEIQSKLMSAKVITRTDDQILRHEKKTEIEKARHLLHDVLCYVDPGTFRKFRKIVRDSGKDVSAHRLAADLLYKQPVKLPEREPLDMATETHSNDVSVEATDCDRAVGVFAATLSTRRKRTATSALRMASKRARQALIKPGRIRIKAVKGRGSVGVGAVTLSC